MKFNIKKISFFAVFTILVFILIFLCNIVYTSLISKLFFENYLDSILDKEANNIFTIDKVVLFSSCNADSTINSNNTTTINNLTQYTDIAIFINNSIDDDFSAENTLKSVAIKDFSFNTTPSSGSPNLYYKNLHNFATPNIVEEDLISSDLDFSVSSEDEIDYNTPTLFNNCANPITLSYVNSNITNNYTVENTDNAIVYDGSLLKKCNILLNDLTCNFSFTVYIENNLSQKFRCPVYISIPLGNDTSSIYDGNYTYTYNPNYSFLMYE